jgi:site-specific recombinase XerD
MTRATYKKQITSLELTEKINPKNKQLISQFLKEKNTRSSDTTIKAYASDLNIFFTWNLLYNENKFFVDIKKLEFANFFSFVTDELKWNSARFSRLRACLSSLSQFIERFFDAEYPNFRNTILKTIENMPKSAAREKTVLTDEEVDDLLSYAKNKDLQQACWLSLAIASGARFQELLRFTTDIIDENNTAFDGLFIETTKAIKTKGRTKSGKLLKKYIIKDLFLPNYHAWLSEREKIMKANDKVHNSIFIKNDGSPATEGTVRSWLRGMDKYMNKNIYPHSFRHRTTTYMSKLGIPPQLIQEIVGWSGIAMVQIYDDTEIKDKKFSELDNLRRALQK